MKPTGGIHGLWRGPGLQIGVDLGRLRGSFGPNKQILLWVCKLTIAYCTEGHTKCYASVCLTYYFFKTTLKRFTSIHQSTVCPGICNLLYLVIYSFHLLHDHCAFPEDLVTANFIPLDAVPVTMKHQRKDSHCDFLRSRPYPESFLESIERLKKCKEFIPFFHWCSTTNHQTWSEYPLLSIIIHHGLWPWSTWYPLYQICQILCLLPVQNGNPSHRFSSEARYWGSSLGDDHPWKRLKPWGENAFVEVHHSLQTYFLVTILSCWNVTILPTLVDSTVVIVALDPAHVSPWTPRGLRAWIWIHVFWPCDWTTSSLVVQRLGLAHPLVKPFSKGWRNAWEGVWIGWFYAISKYQHHHHWSSLFLFFDSIWIYTVLWLLLGHR